MLGYQDIGDDEAGPVPKVELPWLHWEKKQVFEKERVPKEPIDVKTKMLKWSDFE